MAIRRIALASASAALLAVALTVDAGAQVTVPFDHYLCYKATRAKLVPPSVTLIDQFDQVEGTRENVKPKRAIQLCAPLFEKNGVKVLFDPVIHLKRYPITSAAKAHTVEVANQFEQVVVNTIAPVELMVPTTKGITAPPPPPKGEEFSFEHYKCYTLAKARFAKKEVTAVDQFGRHVLVVTSRTRLCNPVTKIVSTRTFPIRQPERHLVCYAVKPQAEKLPTVFTNNQFGQEPLVLGPAKEICLPSFKRLIKAHGERKH
ncbi:MAG TPA: hypothetical protein VG010_04770 [Solirubrobacteraceae bacterium]|jgi:hypothetical protein|nr:hypothetical protein [Solirubrobacteraceae bacterium]